MTEPREDSREKIRDMARKSIAAGDLTGWFEQVYAEAAGDASSISWADLEPNPHIIGWAAPRSDTLRGNRALVVGCGLGDDAEALAALGMRVTAFDISPSAIEWCKRRFPVSSVEYVAASAVDPLAEWSRAFDLVAEAYTLQVLVPELRAQAAQAIAGCVGDGGALLIVARGREQSDAEGFMPWPLTKAELDAFTGRGLREESFEDFMDGTVRRFRAVYRRK